MINNTPTGRIGIFFLTLVSLIACHSEPEIKDMPIESCKISFTDNTPAHVIVEFIGGIGGCTYHHETRHYWEDSNTVKIEVKMIDTSGPGVDCTDDYVEHREAIDLGALTPGDYVIFVNYLEKDFRVPVADGE